MNFLRRGCVHRAASPQRGIDMQILLLLPHNHISMDPLIIQRDMSKVSCSNPK